MAKSVLAIVLLMFTSACGSQFIVQSDPVGADVACLDPKTGSKKSIGLTPIQMPMRDLKKKVGDDVISGEFFTLVVEKQGFAPQSFSIPATRFGTMLTRLDVKLKQGELIKEEKTAKAVLDHLFLAQKLALSQQFERAQAELDKILNEFPSFARAMSMRASIFFAQKNYDESLKWYDEALKADPQMEDAVKMSAKIRGLAGTKTSAPTNGKTQAP